MLELFHKRVAHSRTGLASCGTPNGEPDTFGTGDGWFAYNLAQLQG